MHAKIRTQHQGIFLERIRSIQGLTSSLQTRECYHYLCFCEYTGIVIESCSDRCLLSKQYTITGDSTLDYWQIEVCWILSNQIYCNFWEMLKLKSCHTVQAWWKKRVGQSDNLKDKWYRSRSPTAALYKERGVLWNQSFGSARKT